MLSRQSGLCGQSFTNNRTNLPEAEYRKVKLKNSNKKTNTNFLFANYNFNFCYTDLSTTVQYLANFHVS